MSDRAYLLVAFNFDKEKGLVYDHCFIYGEKSPTHNMSQILCVILEGPKDTYENSRDWIKNYVKFYGEHKPSWNFLYKELTKYDSDEDPKEITATEVKFG